LPGLNVSWQAHLGGLIGGVLIGLVFVQTRRLNQRRTQLALTTAIILVLLALSFSHAPVFA
jgi:membrane associated rhomboid family serine protease